MAVDADLLSAQVLAASRQQESISAQNDLSFAGVQLALSLGLSTAADLCLLTFSPKGPPAG